MNRIAIVRGPHLNKWEMQSYQPLKDDFDITCYTTYDHIHDIDDIGLPIRKFYTPYFFIRKIPTKRLKHYAVKVCNKGFRDNQYMFGLEKHLEDADLIHSVDSYSFSYQALLAKRRFNKRLILTIWQNIPFLNDPGFNHRKIKEALIKETDFFIATTQKAKQALLTEGADIQRIEVVYPGVDLKKFKNLDRDSSLRSGIKNISTGKKNFLAIFIGRFVKQKGIYYLLSCAKELPAVDFLLVGDGPEKKRIEDIIRDKNLNNVYLRGELPYRQIPALINSADAIILPSISTAEWEEQFGMVLVEAMACGKPVVAAETGSIPEVIGEAGILVKPCSAKALADSINLLVKNKELGKRLSVKAINRTKAKFDSSKSSKQLASIYKNILK